MYFVAKHQLCPSFGVIFSGGSWFETKLIKLIQEKKININHFSRMNIFHILSSQKLIFHFRREKMDLSYDNASFYEVYTS